MREVVVFMTALDVKNALFRRTPTELDVENCLPFWGLVGKVRELKSSRLVEEVASSSYDDHKVIPTSERNTLYSIHFVAYVQRSVLEN